MCVCVSVYVDALPGMLRKVTMTIGNISQAFDALERRPVAGQLLVLASVCSQLSAYFCHLSQKTRRAICRHFRADLLHGTLPHW